MSGLGNTLPARVGKKFLDDQGPRWAVLIAWNGLFAIFPIALALATLIGLVVRGNRTLSDKLYSAVVSVLHDPETQRQTLSALEAVKHRAGILAVISFIGLLWSGSALFGTMDEAFARAYGMPPRSFVRQKLMSFAMIFLFGGLGALALLTSSLLPTLENFSGLRGQGPLAFVVQVMVGIITGWILYFAIYLVVPARHQRVGHVWPGALLAGALFEAVTLLFPLYIELNRGVQVYGKAISFVLLLMFFTWLVGMITMVGIETISVLSPSAETQPARDPFAPARTQRDLRALEG